MELLQAFLPVLLVLPVFIFIVARRRKEVLFAIQIAKCFDPNITTGKEARRINRHYYQVAKEISTMPIKNVVTMLSVIVIHQPQSIVSLDTVVGILTPDYFESFKNYKKQQSTSPSNTNNTANKTHNETTNNTRQPNKVENLNTAQQMDSTRDHAPQTTNNTNLSVKDYFNLSNQSKNNTAENVEFKYFKEPKKYAPSIFDADAVCDVCKIKKDFYYETNYDAAICLACLKNGGAKKLAEHKLNYNEEDYLIPGNKVVVNPTYIEEFEYKTPSYESAQDNIWATHCDDFCTYLKPVLWKDIQSLGKNAVNQIKADYVKNDTDIPFSHVKKHLVEDSSLIGHLFQCCHCQKYQLHVELD